MPTSRDNYARRQREGGLDHDLLIEIKTKLDHFSAEIMTLKTEILTRVVNLEAQAARRAEVEIISTSAKAAFIDHEARIRSIETRMYMGLGALAFMQIIIPIIIKLTWQS